MAAVGSKTRDPTRLEEVEYRIIDSLSEKPSSSISEVAKDLRVNRSTASKYLHVLRAKRKVRYRQVGPVKLWCLEDSKWKHEKQS